MIARYFVAIATLIISLPHSNAAENFSVRALLMQALATPDGRAQGIIEGNEANAIHAATGATDPVRAEVSTISRFKQAGCSRLAVKLIQPNTITKQGVKADFALNYELNLCQDGRPPTEKMDHSERNN
jgi:hypothetical protein